MSATISSFPSRKPSGGRDGVPWSGVRLCVAATCLVVSLTAVGTLAAEGPGSGSVARAAAPGSPASVTGTLDVQFACGGELSKAIEEYVLIDESGLRTTVVPATEEIGLVVGSVVRVHGVYGSGGEIVVDAVETLQPAEARSDPYSEDIKVLIMRVFMHPQSGGGWIGPDCGQTAITNRILSSSPSFYSARNYFDLVSEGRVQFRPLGNNGSRIIDVQIDATYGPSCASNLWADLADAEADRLGYPPDSFQRRVYVLPNRRGAVCSWGGRADNATGRVWMRNCRSHALYGHELGHTMDGLFHSTQGGWAYGDESCVMGGGGQGGQPGIYRELMSAKRVHLGWRDAEVVTASGTYYISPLHLTPAQATFDQVLRVPLQTTNKSLMLSFRKPQGLFDGALSGEYANMLNIHENGYSGGDPHGSDRSSDFVVALDTGETHTYDDEPFVFSNVQVTSSWARVTITVPCTCDYQGQTYACGTSWTIACGNECTCMPPGNPICTMKPCVDP